MHLITPYAPNSFLKPCVIFSTLAIGKTKETAVIFVSALDCNHALGLVYKQHISKSCFTVMKKHKTKKDAIEFHIELSQTFQNGGSEKQWSAGWDRYNEIYDKFYEKAKLQMKD